MISSRTHSVIDYIVGVILLVAPYVIGFADGTAVQYVPQVLGVLALLMSLTTRYELSVAKLIPYRTHLVLDIVQSVILLLSPWLFGFASRIWWPHVLVGLLEIVVVALSWRGAASRSSDYSGMARPPRV